MGGYPCPVGAQETGTFYIAVLDHFAAIAQHQLGHPAA
jgi:hypothetical protein